MRWEADVTIAGVLGSMGQRVLQPIVKQQVRGDHDARWSRGLEGLRMSRSVPHRRDAADDGAARGDARDGARHGRGGLDTIWLAEAYPWWRKHGMEAQSSTVLAGMMARETEAADDRLGDHLALHAPPGAGRDGRAHRAGGGRAGPVHRRLRHLEDLPQQHQAGRPAEGDEAARARCATRSRSCAAPSAASASSTTARSSAPTSRRSRPRRTRPTGTCRSTWPAPRR